MVIYMDIVLLLNGLVNFIFLLFIDKVFMDKTDYLNIIIALVISSVFIYLSFISFSFFKYSRFILGILVIIIYQNKVFSKNRKNKLNNNKFEKIILKISLFLALNLMLIGVLSVFKINRWYNLFIGIGVILVIMVFENTKKDYIKLKQLEYNVIIDNYNLIGYLDTGNLSSYKGLPIVYINIKYQQLLDINSLKAININIDTIDTKSSLIGYITNDFKVRVSKTLKEYKVVIVFSNIDFDCILHPQIIL